MSDTPPDRALDRIRAKHLLEAAIVEFEAYSWTSTPAELTAAANKARDTLDSLLDAISQQIAIAKRDSGLNASK